MRQATVLTLLLLLSGAAFVAWRVERPAVGPAPDLAAAADRAAVPTAQHQDETLPGEPPTPAPEARVPRGEEAPPTAAAPPGSQAPASTIDCSGPPDPRTATACEQRATSLFQDYSRAVKEFRDRLGPDQAKLYAAAEFASEGYRLAQCRFEARLAYSPEDDRYRATHATCVLGTYEARTAEVRELAALMSDYSAVPRESSPEDAVNLRDAEMELDAARRLLCRNLDPAQTTAFETAQSAWTAFRDAECRSRAAMFAAQYGSAGGAGDLCRIRMATERTARITSLCD